MKLSEMNSKQAFKTVREITPFISNVLSNGEIKKLLKKVKVAEGENLIEVGYEETIKKIPGLIKLVFDESESDFFNIIAIFEDKKVEEIEEMNFLSLIKLAKEIFMDKGFVEFFLSMRM